MEDLEKFGEFGVVKKTISQELKTEDTIASYLLACKEVWVELDGDVKKKLGGATPNKMFFLRMLQFAKAGLSLSPNANHVYYYLNNAGFGEVTPQGYIFLLANAGFSIQLLTIHENDSHDIDIANLQVSVKPCFPRGELVAVVGIVRSMATNQVINLELAEKSEVDEARKKTKFNGENSVWNRWYTEMAKKVVLHRIAKRLPLMNESSRFINLALKIDFDSNNPLEKKEINNAQGKLDNNFLIQE
jgi:recombinational DNA repair protein RecT